MKQIRSKIFETNSSSTLHNHGIENILSYTVYCNDRQEFIEGALLRMHKCKIQAFTQVYNFRTGSVSFTYYNNATIQFL